MSDISSPYTPGVKKAAMVLQVVCVVYIVVYMILLLVWGGSVYGLNAAGVGMTWAAVISAVMALAVDKYLEKPSGL